MTKTADMVISEAALMGGHDEAMAFLAQQIQRRAAEQQLILLERTVTFQGQRFDLKNEMVDEDPEAWNELGVAGTSRNDEQRPRDAEDLEQARNLARRLYQNNTFARGAHRNRVAFTVGTGIRWSAASTRAAWHEVAEGGDEAKEKLQASVDRVNLAIAAFRKFNRMDLRDQQSVLRGDRDGEVFLRLFLDAEDEDQADNPPSLRFMQPEHIKSPGEEDHAELANGNVINMGVETPEEDAEDVVAVWLSVPPRSGQDDTQAEPERVEVKLEIQEGLTVQVVFHHKEGVDLEQPRGWPVLWSAAKNLVRAEKLLRNMSFVAALQASIALIRKHRNATKAQIESFATSNSPIQVRDSATGETVPHVEWKPGMIFDVGENTDYQAPVSSVNGSQNVAVVQAELRAAGQSVVMHEAMFSGDASNGNFASTQVAETPSVKSLELQQATHGAFQLAIHETALKIMAHFGTVAEGMDEPVTEEDLKQVELQASFPVLVVRNPLSEAQRRDIEHQSGIISKKSWRGIAGLDHEVEERNIREEQENDLAGEPGMEDPNGIPAQEAQGQAQAPPEAEGQEGRGGRQAGVPQEEGSGEGQEEEGQEEGAAPGVPQEEEKEEVAEALMTSEVSGHQHSWVPGQQFTGPADGHKHEVLAGQQATVVTAGHRHALPVVAPQR